MKLDDVISRAIADEMASENGVDMGWSPWTGPRGGHGWINDETGKIVRQKERPGGTVFDRQDRERDLQRAADDVKPLPSQGGLQDYENIPVGELHHVDGWPVRRMDAQTYRLQEPNGKYVQGTAEDVQAHIDEVKRVEALYGRKRIDAALARADEHNEPNPFFEADRNEAEGRRMNAVPDGTPVVAVGHNSRGRVGTLVTEDGVKKVKLEGQAGAVATEFEPLDVKHSWRYKGEPGLFDQPAKPKQGTLFSTADIAAPAPGGVFQTIKSAVTRAYHGLLDRLRAEPEVEQQPQLDDIEMYLAGEWLPVVSSNVEAIRYLPEDMALEVEYRNHGFYRYENVDQDEARSFALAGSKGKWVWDNLRLRGTVYGYNPKHPYSFISGPSDYEPQWIKSQVGRLIHGDIPPAGEGANPFQFSLQLSTWTAYHGPRGGAGWINTETGDIHYGDHAPGPIHKPKARPNTARPEGHLGIPRDMMPQIRASDVHEFLHGLQERNVDIKFGWAAAADLKPVQSRINMDKVNSMMKAADEILQKPVIVSQDGYIIDGHHRWAAAKAKGLDIRTHQVGLPVFDLLKAANTFHKTSYKSVEMSTAHAPKDGVTISGKFYPGGQFIPPKVVAAASTEDRAKLGIEDFADDDTDKTKRKAIGRLANKGLTLAKELTKDFKDALAEDTPEDADDYAVMVAKDFVSKFRVEMKNQIDNIFRAVDEDFGLHNVPKHIFGELRDNARKIYKSVSNKAWDISHIVDMKENIEDDDDYEAFEDQIDDNGDELEDAVVQAVDALSNAIEDFYESMEEEASEHDMSRGNWVDLGLWTPFVNRRGRCGWKCAGGVRWQTTPPVDMARRKATLPGESGGLFNDEWTQWDGPRGGKGWKSTRTGRIVYQEERPGSHEHAGPQEEEHQAISRQQAAEEYKRLGTRAKAFKSWFGDWEHDPANASKVVDPKTGEPKETHEVSQSKVIKDGKPVTVYHGTSSGGWKTFDKSKLAAPESLLYGSGFYFTEDESVAQEYTHKAQPRLTTDEQAAQGVDFLYKHQTTGYFGDFERKGMPRRLKAAAAGADVAWIANQAGLSKEHHQELERILGANSSSKAEVKPVYLNIRKPLDMSDGRAVKTPQIEKIAEAVKAIDPAAIANHVGGDQNQHASNKESLLRRLWDQVDSGKPRYISQIYDIISQQMGKRAVNYMIAQLGYDGITHIGGRHMGDREHRVWIAFEPNQIKSVHNTGTFDPTKDHIDMARIRAVEGMGGLFAVAEEEWVPYVGERGGRGWQSTRTGRVKYQVDKPGSHEHEGEHDMEPEPELATVSQEGHTSLPKHDQQPQRHPNLALADDMASRFERGETIAARHLFESADMYHGGGRNAGAYHQSQAYDSLEAGMNKYLAGKTDPRAPIEQATAQANHIADMVSQLPTQTNRTGEKDAMQQFSTPPHYAYAATWLANLHEGDRVLEPSAGTGSLTTHAQNAGAEVYANELSEDRAAYLRDQLGEDHVFVENAEQIAGILPKRGMPKPTAIVMNPPFSQTAGRMGDKKDLMVGANHIEEAMKLLDDNGRLVAIVGRGMTPDAATYRDWFRKMREKYNLRANVGVEGDEYTKYGTSFGTRILVFDKTGGQSGDPVTGDAESIPDLMRQLEGVRNDRPHATVAEDVGLVGEPGTADGHASGSDPGVLSADEQASGVGGESVHRGSGESGDGPGGSGTDGSSNGKGDGKLPKKSRGRAKKGSGTGDAAGGKSGKQSRAPLPQLRAAIPVTLVPKAAEKATISPSGGVDSLYEAYRPALARVEGAKPHPSPLVESAAMSSVQPPEPTYQPHLSPDIVNMSHMDVPQPDGTTKKVEIGLSEAGLEPVIYAGQAHSKFLPAEEGEEQYRRGYFIGDGTGAGKGRQIAGIITDNWNQGRKKHLWLSLKQPLYEDAHRDWRDLGNDPKNVFNWNDLKKGKAPDEGIMFMTYDTLKSAEQKGDKTPNVDKVANWLGDDFDGVIAFDEAHAMANAVASEGARGAKQPSARALAGMELQRRFPKARVVYVSATGATEVKNLAYTERLGLWGRGTAFGSKDAFFEQMDAGGIAAMESVAQSMKAMGMYGARSLSFDDGTEKGRVTYDRLTHKLSADQRAMYDAACDGWQNVLRNIDKALEVTGGKDSKEARKNAASMFWGSQQRFFNQVMTSMQTPAVINAIQDDLDAGRAPVVQLVNTMEAATKRAIAKQAGKDEDELEDYDVGPKEILSQYLEKSFPVDRYEKYVDQDGNERSRLVETFKAPAGGITIDGKTYKADESIPRGAFETAPNEIRHKIVRERVQDPDALAMREELLDKVGLMDIPSSPMDQIIDHYGHEMVAECTGRSVRVIKGKPETRNIHKANTAEAAAFQDGKKKILIFSDAGGTGRSYHADKRAKNQGQRVHYMLQPGWRADNAVQGLGRTHRTNQAMAPTYRLVEIDELKAQKRFISTIARRLDQLGALTKGQRAAGSSGLFKASDNLESPEAKTALATMFMDIAHNKIPGLNPDEVFRQMGFLKESGESKGKPDEPIQPPMSQFLNRMLSLNIDMQTKVFDAYEQYHQRAVDHARAAGTLNTGVENYPADSIDKVSESTVYRDKESGASAHHFVANVTQTVEKRPWAQVSDTKAPLHYAMNERSGQVWAVYHGPDKTITEKGKKQGSVVKQYWLKGPTGARLVDADKYNHYRSNYQRIFDNAEAERLWKQQHDEAPSTRTTEQHFLTGALLPIWDKMPTNQPRIYRLKTGDGQQIVGRHIPKDEIEGVLHKLGVAGETASHDARDVHGKLENRSAKRVTLNNGWALKPIMLQGERSIELVGPGINDLAQIQADGVMKVRVAGKTRFFVPTGETGKAVMERITRHRPITDVEYD